MTGALTLTAYRASMRLAAPIGPLLLRWRLKNGKEDPLRWRERLGEAGRPRPPGALAWLHGASVGEGLALLPLVTGLIARGLQVLVTTGTVTSSRILAERLPPGAFHQFVPLDLPTAATRFLDHWRPDFAGFAESELWPNLLDEARWRGIPTVLLNARMSERSFRRWRSLGSPIRHVLDGFRLVLAQSDADAARFTELGARAVATTGNVKFDVPAPGVDDAQLAALRACIGTRPLWLAASTHAGEDELCCAVHREVARKHPGLLTLVVPRKADRGAALADYARAQGLAVRLRSLGAAPDQETDLYIADTMGEIGLFFRLAPIVFMGKSLGEASGGQNPIEPAKLGCAILHGPAIGNFRDIYGLFDAAGGSLTVTHADELAQHLSALLDAPERAAAMADRAAAVVAANLGSAERSLKMLMPIIDAIRHRPAA